MNFSWETLAASLESPQGSTVYSLLALLLLSAASLRLSRARPGDLARAITYTLAVLIGLRLVEVIVFALAWSGSATAARAMPPLERGLHLITLLALAWLWTQPTAKERRTPLVFAVAILADLVLAWALFIPWLNGPTGIAFNYTDADYAWGAACIVALLFAVLRVAKAKQTVGLAVFGILLLGQTAHLLLAEPFANMPLATRAATLLVLPLLLLMPIGKKVNVTVTDKYAEEGGAAFPAGSDSKDEFIPEEEDAGFFDFDQLDEEPLVYSAEVLARQTAEELGADLCVFASIDEGAGELDLAVGYNVAHDAPVEPTGIPLGEVPRLRAALSGQQPLMLSAKQRLPELLALSKALRLSFQPYLLTLPLQVGDGSPWAMLLLSLEHAWQPEDELRLLSTSRELGANLAAALGLQTKADPFQLLESEDEPSHLHAEQLHFDDLESKPQFQLGPQGNELVQGLQVENERLKSARAAFESGEPARTLAGASEETKRAREELRLALEEVARLHEDLEAALRAPQAAEQVAPQVLAISTHQVEVIASVAQELRQPLSSVVGYTELLLGESVGILGALQRKFLERVRSSTERMNRLIDNLIRISQLDQAGFSATRKPVDLGAVIDEAIGLLRAQFQEKRLVLRVDLPESLPDLNTDRDALQQILYHLLLNADAATPTEGELTLRAVVDNQRDLGDFVLIQVSDSGGGIPEGDLERVFSRVYRASNPVVPGVGDTGVGLSIAETLTQALGGRIWVESEAGVGATFSILLPLNPS